MCVMGQALPGPCHPECAGETRSDSMVHVCHWGVCTFWRPLHLLATDLTFAQLQRIRSMRLGWRDLAVTTGCFRHQPHGQHMCQVCAGAGHTNLFGQLPVEDVTHRVV